MTCLSAIPKAARRITAVAAAAGLIAVTASAAGSSGAVLA